MTPAAYAQINLSAIQHNIGIVRQFAPNAKLMPVIKANAYGHGLLRIAKQLTDSDGLAVARVDEGVSLRQAGIDQPITVLEGFICQSALETLIEYQLDSVIYSFQQLKLFRQYSGHQKISVWLKLDTGMNRLGFSETEFSLAYQQLSQLDGINQPIALMSHFSSADDLRSKQTSKQIQRFKSCVSAYSGEKSLANSAAILAWTEAITDWVRPGIMLYGVSPFADKSAEDWGLKPVMSLYSRLISIKPIAAGESVGYGESWKTQTDTRLGIISIGYGDGYPRYAKVGTPVLIRGQKVPLVGRVSMDMITVDLNCLPDAQIGDTVTLWGEGLPVETIAQWAETIPYTLLCGVTQRVERLEH